MICLAILMAIMLIMLIAWSVYNAHLESCGWEPSIEASNVQITFSQFRTLYNNDPDKTNWSLCDGYVLYIPMHAKIAFMHHRDYHRYNRFRGYIVRKQEEAREIELLLKITNQVRNRVNKDVDNAFEDIDSAKRDHSNIVGRINREKGKHGENGKI